MNEFKEAVVDPSSGLISTPGWLMATSGTTKMNLCAALPSFTLLYRSASVSLSLSHLSQCDRALSSANTIHISLYVIPIPTAYIAFLRSREALEILGYSAQLKAGQLPPLDEAKERSAEVRAVKHL